MIETNNEQNDAVIKKTILLVEDDTSLAKLVLSVLKDYQNSLDIKNFSNASDVIEYLQNYPKDYPPQAIILDLMMPYGSARKLLDPNEIDVDDNNTGLNLLHYIRQRQLGKNLESIWVSIITARSPIAVEAKAKELLKNDGEIYFKPFDTFQFENDLMIAIGIPSKVPGFLLDNNNNDSNSDKEDR